MTLLVLLLCAGLLAAQPNLATEAPRGKQAMAEGRFADAALSYDKLVRALPDDPGMRLNLGMALSMDGRIRDAVPHLQRAVELRPGLLPAWLFLGSNWLELGDAEKAARALRTVVDGEPTNIRARELLGEALLSLERYEPAAGEFQTATEQRPQSARAWYGLGRSYEGLARGAFAMLERVHGESGYAQALRAEAFDASRQADAAKALPNRRSRSHRNCAACSRAARHTIAAPIPRGASFQRGSTGRRSGSQVRGAPRGPCTG